MSITATHPRHHVHAPWMPIIAVLVAVALAAVVLVLVNQPATPTIGESTAVVVPAPAANAAPVPMPETQVLRRQLSDDYARAMAHQAIPPVTNNPHPFNFTPSGL